jgi:hypothetical protein
MLEVGQSVQCASKRPLLDSLVGVILQEVVMRFRITGKSIHHMI